jgi:hypothetical protein
LDTASGYSRSFVGEKSREPKETHFAGQRPTDAGGKHAKILSISTRFLFQLMKPEERTRLVLLQFAGLALAAFRLQIYLIRLPALLESELLTPTEKSFEAHATWSYSCATH